MDYKLIIEKAEQAVRKFIQEHQNLNLFYHNILHTENVVSSVNKIAEHYQLSNREHFICCIAAWFHDIGYFEDQANHEHCGVQKAREFLMNNAIDEEITIAVESCILATIMPQKPLNLLEEIVCDADLYHLGTRAFFMQNKLIHKETEALHHIKISKDQWRNGTIRLMENHHYHTEFCRELLDKKKKHNLEKLKKKSRQQIASVNPMDLLVHEYINEVPQTGEINNRPLYEQPEKGAETLFRIASGIGQRLNEQADTKAHILISVNTLIISLFIALVLRKADAQAYLSTAGLILLIANLLTIIFSVLSTRPYLPEELFGQNEVESKKVNLLFFGNFYKMNFEEYSKNMFQVIGDRHLIYSTLVKNLYDQGVALGRKYKLLKIAYNIFVAGIVVSVIAFVIAVKH